MQDACSLKSSLSFLLGTCRPLELARESYTSLLRLPLDDVKPDFYMRLAERALAFLRKLAETGGRGAEWAAAAAVGAKPLLAAPTSTEDMRWVAAHSCWADSARAHARHAGRTLTCGRVSAQR